MLYFKGRNRGLIVVSNRLPFYRAQDKWGATTWHKAAGGLITALEPIVMESQGTWIGWDGYSQPTGHQELELLPAQTLIPEETGKKGNYFIGCVPMTDAEVDAYYNRFSNSTLWALFHYFFEKCALDYASWHAYQEINKRFASYVAGIAKHDDLVWIQDYHLFLTPLYLRQLRPELEIHFFLHIPFPHIDIFAILPWQDQIVEGLLNCNTVGFHHEQYLKNFMGAVEQYRQKNRQLKKTPHTYANPISIDFDLLNETSKSEAVRRRTAEIRTNAHCPKLIIGVDRIDYSKGIKERLLALENLIEANPQLKERFFYYQLVVPSREDVDSYQQLKKEVDEIVGRINGLYSTDTWTPIHYHYATVAFAELIALYAAADVCLVTPLRDGMNLVCKEYIAAHSDEDGILILSKFAGASAEITDALTVNPYNIDEIQEALFKSLHMAQPERTRRMVAMRKKIKEHSLHSWLQSCLAHFEQA